MPKNEVHSAAEQLGELLSQNDALDDETRAALEQLRAEVDHALVTETPPKKKTSEIARGVIDRIEGDHPDLTALVQRLADALAAIGL